MSTLFGRVFRTSEVVASGYTPDGRPPKSLRDVPAREAATQKGDQFLSSSGCYASYEVRRVSLDKPVSTEDIQGFAAESKLKVKSRHLW